MNVDKDEIYRKIARRINISSFRKFPRIDTRMPITLSKVHLSPPLIFHSTVHPSNVNPHLRLILLPISQQFKDEIVNRGGRGREPRSCARDLFLYTYINKYIHIYTQLSRVGSNEDKINELDRMLIARGGRALSEISLLDIVGCSSR